MQLSFQTDGSDGKAEMLIDYQSESIGFTILVDGSQQYDFNIEKDEWETFKNFIELEMRRENEYNLNHPKD